MRALRLYWISLTSCLYLLTLGLENPDHRHLLNQLNWGLGRGLENRPDPDCLTLPVKPLSALAGDTRVTLVEGDHAAGNVTAYELFCLCALLKTSGAHSAFEIGTFDGRTTLNLAVNLPSEGKVYTLDLPREEMDSTALKLDGADRTFVDKDRSGERFLRLAPDQWPEVERIEQHFGDSAHFDFEPFAGSCGFVFVDGSHAYDYVVSDTRRVLSLLPDRRGWILWHDYTPDWEGVPRALNELAALNPELEFVNLAGTTLVALHLQGQELQLWS